MRRSRPVSLIDPARRRDLALVAPPVALLWIGHLVGGASGPVAAAWLTAAFAAVAAGALAANVAVPGPAARRLLLRPIILYAVLALFVGLSLAPGSAALATGPWHARVGAGTLSLHPAATALELLKLGGLAAAFVLALACAASRRRLRLTLRIFTAFAVVWALVALAAYAVGGSGPEARRLSGAFVSPNVAASVLGVALFVAVAAGRRGGDRKSGAPVLAAAAVAVLGAALLLTASRFAVAAVLLLGAPAAVAAGRDAWARAVGLRARLVLAAAGVAGFAALAAAAPRLLSRVGTAGEAVVDRLAVMGAFAQAAVAAPLFGYGLGAASALSRLLLTPGTYPVLWNVRAAHNLGLQWLVEGGLVGAVLALGVLILVLGVAVRGRDLGQDARSWPLFGAVALVLVHGQIDYAPQIYSVALTFAFLLGLVFGRAAAPPEEGRRRRLAKADDVR